MNTGYFHFARQLVFAVSFCLAAAGPSLSLADDHDPEQYRPEAKDAATPYAATCAKAKNRLKDVVLLDKKAGIIWALRQSLKDQAREDASLFPKLDASTLMETCLETFKTDPHVQALLAVEDEADSHEGIKRLIDLIHPKTSEPADGLKRSAASHALANRIAYKDTKPWITAILDMHEGAISPFRALQLLTKHRDLMDHATLSFDIIAEALAREKLSLSIAGRNRVKDILKTLSPADTNSIDKNLLALMKFLYDGDATGVVPSAQTALAKAEQRAGHLAEQWNENLSAVIGTDGRVALDASVTVSPFKGDDKKITGGEWLKEQEATYGKDALIQWAIARGGEQGGKTIIAALKGKDPEARELVVQLPSPTLKVGDVEIHTKDRVVLNITDPKALAAEAGKILPTRELRDQAAWDNFRLNSSKGPEKDADEAPTIRVIAGTVVRTPAKPAPPPTPKPLLKFEELVAETEWSEEIPLPSTTVSDASKRERYEIKNPLPLADVLKKLEADHAIPLGPEATSPAIVGFDKTKKILVVQEVDTEGTWYYAVPFDHYSSLVDPKAPRSLGSRIAEIRQLVLDTEKEPWSRMNSVKTADLNRAGAQTLLLSPKSRITGRGLTLAQLKEALIKDNTQVNWGPGSGYIFGFDDDKNVLYLTFDGFKASEKRKIFTITYEQYGNLFVLPKD